MTALQLPPALTSQNGGFSGRRLNQPPQHTTMTISDNGAAPVPSSFEVTGRVARYAYDRLSFAGPLYAVALGTTAVWSIGALEGALFLMPKQHSRSAWLVKARFVSRYGLYNIVPSVIWGRTHHHSLWRLLGT